MELHKYLQRKKKKRKQQLSQHRRGRAWQGQSSEEGQEMGGSRDSRRPGLAAPGLRAAPLRPFLTNGPQALLLLAASGS